MIYKLDTIINLEKSRKGTSVLSGINSLGIIFPKYSRGVPKNVPTQMYTIISRGDVRSSQSFSAFWTSLKVGEIG